MARKRASPAPDRPLGRTVAERQAWNVIVASMPVMPRVFRGSTPRRSPDNHRFMPKDAWWQIRGFCVGYGRARQVQYLTRVPANATPQSDPLPGIRVSPLYSYALAREYARTHGVNLGSGDGAIVSHSILAAVDDGVDSWEQCPCPPEVEKNWPNERPPDPDDREAGKEHTAKTFSIADSWDAVLEGVAGGYVCNCGTQIPQGMMQTRPDDGHFDWAGPYIGGHSYLIVDYDMDKDEVILANSWPQWGWREKDAAGGFSNLARTSLTAFAKEFTAQKLRSGYSEATFVALRAGYHPIVTTTFDDTLTPPKE